MFLWFEHAVSDRISDRRQAAIAPEPSSTGKIRTDGRADAAGAMAAGAGCPRDLTMKNLFAEGDLLAVVPCGTGSAAASMPASGLMPSGGRTSGDVLASTAAMARPQCR